MMMHRLGALFLLLASPTAAEPLSRADLVLPEAELASLLEGLERPDGRLGFDAQELSQFSRDELLLNSVRNLFRDLPAIPRFSGRLADQLLAAEAKPDELLVRSFLLLDVSAGRHLPLPPGWGVEGVADEADSLAVLQSLVSASGGALSQRARGDFARLPASVQRLVVRLVIGQLEAEPWVRAAFDERALRELHATGGFEALYARAIAPWNDERLGQLASRNKAAFEALRTIELESLAFGSVVWTAHLRRALDELEQAGGVVGVGPSFKRLEFRIGERRVVVTGTRPNTLSEPAALHVDLGGDDLYLGRHAASEGPARPISAVVDLGGNDRYESGESDCSFGCGLFGLGALIDLSGDDRYAISESGLGAAWHGTGVLVDRQGRDHYAVQGRWGQAAAHAGVGLLVDSAGDDAYSCGHQSQGMGSTLGAGVLLDVAGNDSYLARDDGNVSELYLGQSVAMSQGCGYGRRADLGDGKSLAGGFGVLVDGAGDDDYHAQVWSQGAGYWWAVGILEDLGGNDSYRNGKYSSGAAAHFAIGSHVDATGDDRYNQGNDTAKNQFQGHARDGSVGVFIDGWGDDAYLFHSHCAGSADLASLALFWDRAGDDRYDMRYEEPEGGGEWGGTPPFGSASVYAPFRSFRDDLPAIGLFLDTGGEDVYPEGVEAGNDKSWTTDRREGSHGRGADGGH